MGGDGRIAEKGAAREKLPTAAYQTQQEQIKVTQLGKKGTVRALKEKRGSLRFLEYLFFFFSPPCAPTLDLRTSGYLYTILAF